MSVNLPIGDPLLVAAAKVDVLDTARRIIANPRRHAPSATAAEVLTLAIAAEKFWAIALEAEILVNAIKRPITGNDTRDADRDDLIQQQLVVLSDFMAALRGTTTNTEE
jgi:hypothetical protein